MGRRARQHWYGLYRSIKPLVESYSGDDSVHRLIRSEAEAAGYEEKVVKRMLNAGTFLDDMVANPLPAESVKCGYAHIELLSRMNKLDSEQAHGLLTPVLANNLTIQELRDRLAQCSTLPGGGQINARSKARRRIAEHRKLAFRLIEQAGPKFFGSPRSEPILVHRFRSLSQFILLNYPDEPIAILPRLGDSSRKETVAAAELIALALSHRPYFHHIWFILPGDSLLAREVAGQAYELGALRKWLYLAVPDDDSTSLVPYDNLGQLLQHQMWGESKFNWTGVSLVDGSPKYGSLDPRE